MPSWQGMLAMKSFAVLGKNISQFERFLFDPRFDRCGAGGAPRDVAERS